MKKQNLIDWKHLQQQCGLSQCRSFRRLHRVQNILKEFGDNDVILAVLGIDSSYNEGCKEFVNFLLFDFYSIQAPHLEDSGIPDDVIDDVIFVVRTDSVSVYCNPIMYEYLLAYICHWRNMSIHCLPAKEEDQDVWEEFKIKSLVAMLDGAQKVWLPYNTTKHSWSGISRLRAAEFDRFAVEKWPLIQAYGLEGVGGGKFFTMEFDVGDIHDRLQSVYDECDPVALERIMIKSSSLVHRHWMETVNLISSLAANARDSSPLLNLTHKQAAEPLNSYFTHGRLTAVRAKTSDDGEGAMPFVRFGRHTSSDDQLSPSATVADSGVDGCHALHVVIQTVAPKSAIACARTYFISPAPTASNKQKMYLEVLTGAYARCVRACQSAVSEYCRTRSATAAREAAAGELLANEAAGCKHTVTLVAVDKRGKRQELKEGERSTMLKRATVSVDAIADGRALGRVCFTDTFLDATVDVTQSDDDVTEARTRHLIVTANIPTYMEWTMTSDAGKRNDDDDEGETVACENVYLCCNGAPKPCETNDRAEVRFHVGDGDATTMTLTAPNLPAFAIRRDHVTSLEWFDRGKKNAVSALQIVLNDAAAIPASLRSNLQPIAATDRQPIVIGLAMFPHSLALELFNSKVAPRWRKTRPGFVDDDDVPLREELRAAYDALQRKYLWIARNDRLVSGSDGWKRMLANATELLQPDFHEFMSHFMVASSLGGARIDEQRLSLFTEHHFNAEAAANKPPPALVDESNKVCVTVVIGIPGSHVDVMCSSIVTVNRERVRWVTVRCQPSSASSWQLDKTHLQKQLSDAVARRRTTRPGAAATKRLRIVVECSGFFDLVDVLSCLLKRDDVHVGCVTSCVEPSAAWLQPRLLFPAVTDHCAEGLSNCIAFTGSDKDDRVEMQALLRGVNRSAAFAIAEGGRPSRAADFELIVSETAFCDVTCARARTLCFPQLVACDESVNARRPLVPVDEVSLEFSQPLLKGVFETRLRAIHNSLQPFPFRRNVYFIKGHTSFVDDPKLEYDVTFAARPSTLTMTAREQTTENAPAPPPRNRAAAATTKPHQLRFFGVGLERRTLMEWVRNCGRQQPSRKCPRTRATLSAAEERMIQKRHETDPLPEGFFFNGTQYCSLLDNTRTYTHPYLEKFIDEYLREENRKVDAYNAKIEARGDLTGMFA